MGDEQIMLDHQLNGPGQSMVIVRANPDRVAGAEAIIAKYPGINVILLDDAFQHRKVARNFDIVLVRRWIPLAWGSSAAWLDGRQPARGLRRADAIVITHCEAVRTAALEDIEKRVRLLNPKASIYRATHKQTGLRTTGAAVLAPPDRTMKDLLGARVLRVLRHWKSAAIASLSEFDRRKLCRPSLETRSPHLPRQGIGRPAGRRAGPRRDLLVTTEKDWVKIGQLPDAIIGNPPIWRLEVEMRLLNDGDKHLAEQIRQAIAR